MLQQISVNPRNNEGNQTGLELGNFCSRLESFATCPELNQAGRQTKQASRFSGSF